MADTIITDTIKLSEFEDLSNLTGKEKLIALSENKEVKILLDNLIKMFNLKAVAPLPIHITDTDTFSDGVFIPIETGEYVNLNPKLTYNPEEGWTQFVKSEGVWIKNVIPINFTPTGEVKPGDFEAVSGGNVFDYISFKKTTKNDLIYIEDVNYIISSGGNITPIDTNLYESRVAVIDLKEIGNYYIKGFVPISNFSYYRLEDDAGNKLSNGTIESLPVEFNSNKISTTSPDCKLYLNVKYTRFSNYVQNEDSLHIFFNSIPENIVGKDYVYEANKSYLRQFLNFNEGVIYYKFQQVNYKDVIYEVIRTTDGTQLPDHMEYFKKVVGVEVESEKTKNIFNINTDILTDIYLSSSGNINSNTSSITSKVAKVKLTIPIGEASATFSINQFPNANNFYRIEKIDGTKIEGGTLTTASDNGLGRKISITEEVYFYHLIYFKNTANNVESSIDDFDTYQIEQGSSVTSFEPFERLTTINKLPINPFTVEPNRYYKKRLLTAGDSLTAGTLGGYVKYLSEILGCEITNLGSSGSKTGRMVGILTDIKDRSDTDTSSRIAPDYTLYEGGTIMIGTNIDTVIGSLTDIPTDTVYDHVGNEIAYFNTFGNTYYGNLSLVIEWIKWKNPHFVVNLVSPPYGGYENADLVASRMAEIANFYSINFIDGTHNSGLLKKMRGQYTYDGTHFNEMGNEVWGIFLGNRLKN